MERLDINDFCEDCGELDKDCACYFSFQDVEYYEIKPRFEYAFEQLTNENSIFRKNMPIK